MFIEKFTNVLMEESHSVGMFIIIHIDGNKLNNSTDNLIAIPERLHNYIHEYGNKTGETARKALYSKSTRKISRYSA
jgi:hypothetical protein